MWDDSSLAMVNPINCVGVMGAGIALEMKKSFPYMYTLYKVGCQHKWLVPGDVLVYQNATHTVVNVATKGHFKYSSKLKYIEDIVVNLNTLQQVLGEQIAMPMIGCGKGGLKWEQVAYRLEPLNYQRVNVYTGDFIARAQPTTFFNSMLIIHDGQVYDTYEEQDYEIALDYYNAEFGNVHGIGRNVEKNMLRPIDKLPI